MLLLSSLTRINIVCGLATVVPSSRQVESGQVRSRRVLLLVAFSSFFSQRLMLYVCVVVLQLL